jgi:enoyl-CoA hydratase
MGVKLKAAEVERNGPVGIVKIHPLERMIERSLEPDCDEFIESHTAIALGLEELRFDDNIRVVIITGSRDGEFCVTPKTSHYEVEKYRNRLARIVEYTASEDSSPSEWRASFRKTAGYVELLLNYPKPVIARVNGDVIGSGQSVMWGCDFIIAREDAVVSDVHMGQGEVTDSRGNSIGFPWAAHPGDGAMAFAPINFSTYKYKEYQMLSMCLTAGELADMHIINYAVPAAELDDKVDEIVRKLLARPQEVLTRLRKLLQKPIIAQANLQGDLASAHEDADFAMHAREGHFALGWKPIHWKDVQLPNSSVGRPKKAYSE